MLLEILPPPELHTKSMFSFSFSSLFGVVCVWGSSEQSAPSHREPSDSHSTEAGFLFPTVLALSPPVVARMVACVLSQNRSRHLSSIFFPVLLLSWSVFNVKQPGSGCGAPATARSWVSRGQFKKPVLSGRSLSKLSENCWSFSSSSVVELLLLLLQPAKFGPTCSKAVTCPESSTYLPLGLLLPRNCWNQPRVDSCHVYCYLLNCCFALWTKH